MAITLNNRPSVLTPGFNQMMFNATSNQTLQPNFKYYIQINVDGNALSPLVLPARPVTADVVFDIKPFVVDYLKSYFPFGLTGWQQCTKSIINVTVNIGERYGTTPTVYPGVTETYKPYYASLTNDEMANYNPASYTFLAEYCLNNYSKKIKATSNDNLVFYWLLSTAGDLASVRVRTYNSSGVLQSDSEIPNPLTSASTPNQYICIDLGINALATISSGLVTGTYPIITSGVKTVVYTFKSALFLEVEYTLTVEDCCNDGNIEHTLYYANRKGAFDHVNFCDRVKEDMTTLQTSYRTIEQYFKTSYRNSAGTLVYPSNPLDQTDKVLSNTYELNKTYTSAPLGEHDYTMLSECINSPKLILLTGTKYTYLKSKDTSFSFKRKTIDKILQFIMNVKNNLTERRQSSG